MAATHNKQPVTGAGPFNGVLTWVDQRFPLISLWKEHAAEYYAPKNFNFWYYFGSLAMLVLVIQIVTGIFLVMHYKPDAAQAFASVEYIMRDVPFGWLIRYMHSTGASAFFIVIYLHMFRGLMYGSYRGPRELIWIFGMIIYLMLMAEAFFGYLLPWGQMSYWGAQVIVNLFDALPLIGPDLALWIRGDFVVSDATLNRFFAFHVIAIPLVLVGLVAAHLMALHEVGSNNPDGVEIKKTLGPDGHPVDGIPFHPYYTVKDTLGVMVFLALFAIVLFFMPEMGGYFLEYNNFIPADPLKTPSHIAPVWYFTPYYSILRATTADFMLVLAAGVLAMLFLIMRTDWIRAGAKSIALLVSAILLVGFYFIDAKVWGVVLMGLAVMIFFLLPWLDASPVKSVRYKGGLYKTTLTIFVITFLVLGFFGTQPVTKGGTYAAQLGTVLYFAFFLLMPWYSRMDKTKPVPERVTA
ncbi:MAG TPA: cytochrome b N-terminal domain-containing protein [Burkholderiales bacterium]|nr:cytochrome b N-terminal domain-containing protein [Burkholderiales bacterium]